MEPKHIAGLLAFVVVVAVGTLAARMRPRLRDACAALLLVGTTHYYAIGVNLVSREWYRGTTRGFEITWLDALVLILLWSGPPSERRGPRPASLVPMLLFVAYCALNVLFSDPQLFGWFELSKMVRGILVFLAFARYVRSDRELRVIAWGASAALLYEGVVATHERYILGHPRTYGTLDHPNSLSMYCLILVPVVTAIALSDAPRRLRQVCALAAVSGSIAVLFTLSRAGFFVLWPIVGGVLVVCGALRVTLKNVAVGLLLVALSVAVVSRTWRGLSERITTYGSFSEEYLGGAKHGRGEYLKLAAIIVDDRFFGCGLNNWSYCVSNDYGRRVNLPVFPYDGVDAPPPPPGVSRWMDDPQAPPAHNLAAITVGETGWPGLILLTLMWGRWLQLGARFLPRRSPALASRFGVGVLFALLGATAQSVSEWAFRQTPIFFEVHALVGALAAVVPALPVLRARARGPREEPQGLAHGDRPPPG